MVSVALVKLFEPKLEQYAEPIDTEHQIASLMSWQEESGFPFDVSKHKARIYTRTELDDLAGKMRDTFYWVLQQHDPKRVTRPRATLRVQSSVNSPSSAPPPAHIGWASSSSVMGTD